MTAKPLNKAEYERIGRYTKMVTKREKFTPEQADDFFDLTARVGSNARHFGTLLGAGFLQAVAGLIKAQNPLPKEEK